MFSPKKDLIYVIELIYVHWFLSAQFSESLDCFAVISARVGFSPVVHGGRSRAERQVRDDNVTRVDDNSLRSCKSNKSFPPRIIYTLSIKNQRWTDPKQEMSLAKASQLVS